MLSNSYAQYIKGIINLVRSITLKSIHTMNSMNSFLKAGGDIIGNHESGYKYYINLNGEYYTSSNGLMDDRQMKTFSPDTDSEVVLTKDLLITHIKLHQRLKRRDVLYTTLLSTYPENELLINGIINPVPYEVASVAKDYEILYYDYRYVDVGESNLIEKLQQFLYNFTSRWDVSGYRLCDPLYPAAFMGVLYVNMVSAIINIRLENCGTEYAHEYHIWNYIGSWFELDKYRANITHNQALFLYRNIRYIVNNGGSNNILSMLNDNLIKGFGLNLNKFDIHRAIDDALVYLANDNYDLLNANVIVTKRLYDDNVTDLNNLQQSTTAKLVYRMVDQATLNKHNVAEDISTVNTRTSGSGVSRIPTGIMEVVPEGVTAANIVHKDRVKITTWLYLASINKIDFEYNITLPGEDLFNFPLTPSDAAIMLMYASAKIFGLQGTDVPQPRVTGIACIPVNDELELRGLVKEEYLVRKNSDGSVLWDHYETILNTVKLDETITSLEHYVEYSNDIINKKIMQWIIPFVNYTALGRSQLKALIRAFNTDHLCVFTDTVTYQEYFTDIGIDLSSYSDQSLHNLIVLILQNYIGIEPEGVTGNSINQNIIEILRILCSYTVNIINNEELDPPMPIDWCFSVPEVSGLYLNELMVLELKNYIDCKPSQVIGFDIPAPHLVDYNVTETLTVSTATGTNLMSKLITAYWCCVNAGGVYTDALVESIYDNTPAKPLVNLRVSVDEGTELAQTAITVTAYTDIPVVGNQTVALSVSGTNVTLGDYSISQLSIPLYASTNEATVTFTVLDDDLVENVEVATISIVSISGGLRYGTDVSKNITIYSDDVEPPPTITVELHVEHDIVSESVATGNNYQSALCWLVASEAVPSTATADLVISGDVLSGDYMLSDVVFTILEGTTMSNEILISIVNDYIIENTELLTVGITNLSPEIQRGLTTVKHISVLDDDVIPAANLSLSQYTTNEADLINISVTVTATAPVVQAQTLLVNIGGNGITVDDYSITSETLTIADGETIGEVTLQISDDSLIEETEYMTVTISDPSAGIVLGVDTQQILEIIDNDGGLPEVNLTFSHYTTNEADSTAISVTVTATAPVVGEQTVVVGIGGTNIYTDDYSLDYETLTILDGETVSVATLLISNDAIIENTEYLTVTLLYPSAGIVLGSTIYQELEIIDDDGVSLPRVNLTLSQYTSTETEQTAVFVQVEATAPMVSVQTVDIAITGTGITTGDYSISTETIYLFENQQSNEAYFVVNDDDVIEGTEFVIFTLTNPSAGIALGTTITQQLEIIDNDEEVVVLPAVNLMLSVYSVTETP